MKYSKDQVETKAVNAINNTLGDEPSLETSLNTLDKKPFIDGFINVYNVVQGEDKTKSKFKGVVNVQVKGTTKKRILKNGKFSVKRVDLKGYYNSQGCIYFVVYISEKDTKIFYKDLQVFDIKQILDNKDSKSISLIFKEFPMKRTEVKNIIHHSLIHQQKQNKNIVEIDTEKLSHDKITIKYYGSNEDFEDVIRRGTYTYVTTPEGIEVPLDKITKDNFKLYRLQTVRLENGEEVKLSSYHESEEFFKVTFADYMDLVFHKSKVDLNIRLNNNKNLKDLIKSIEIVESIVKKGFNLNGAHVHIFKYIEETSLEDEVRTLVKFREYLISIHETLLKLNISTEFNYFNLDIYDKQILNSLSDTLKDSSKTGLFDLWFNQKYYIFIKTETVEGNLFYLNDRISMVANYANGESITILPSLVPNDKHDKLPDFSTDKMRVDIYSLFDINDDDKHVCLFVTNYLLSLINSYDRTNNIDLLKLALDISDILVEKEASITHNINYLQVVKRQRKLSNLENQLLETFKSNTDDLMEIICIKILLEETNIEKLINKLNKENRDQLMNSPIINLFQSQ